MIAKKISFWFSGFQARKNLGSLSLCYRPIILDPADPTYNVATGHRWDIVAQSARCCLKQYCCYDFPNWKLKVMSPLWLPEARSSE